MSIAEVSKLPNAASASRRILTTDAKLASRGSAGASGLEMMQSPTAARVNPSATLVSSSRPGGRRGSNRREGDGPDAGAPSCIEATGTADACAATHRTNVRRRGRRDMPHPRETQDAILDQV